MAKAASKTPRYVPLTRNQLEDILMDLVLAKKGVKRIKWGRRRAWAITHPRLLKALGTKTLTFFN